jgi:hypothetical protein
VTIGKGRGCVIGHVVLQEDLADRWLRVRTPVLAKLDLRWSWTVCGDKARTCAICLVDCPCMHQRGDGGRGGRLAEALASGPPRWPSR